MRGKFYIFLVFLFGLLPFFLGVLRLFYTPIFIVYPLSLDVVLFYFFLYLFLFLFLIYKFIRYYLLVNTQINYKFMRVFVEKINNYYQLPYKYVEFFFWRNPLSFFRYFHFFFVRLYFKLCLHSTAVVDVIEFRLKYLYKFLVFSFYTVFVVCVLLAVLDVMYFGQLYYVFVGLFLLLFNQILYFIFCRLLSVIYLFRSDLFLSLTFNTRDFLNLNDLDTVLFNQILAFDGFVVVQNGVVVYYHFDFFGVLVKDVYFYDISNLFFLQEFDNIFGESLRNVLLNTDAFAVEYLNRFLIQFNGHSYFINKFVDYKSQLEKHRLIISILRLLVILLLLLYVLIKNSGYM